MVYFDKLSTGLGSPTLGRGDIVMGSFTPCGVQDDVLIAVMPHLLRHHLTRFTSRISCRSTRRGPCWPCRLRSGP